MSGTSTVYLGLGSNVGDRLRWLKEAVRMLDETEGITVEAISPIYETSPVGYLEQPDFLNLVVRTGVTLSPRRMLDVCLDVERRLERVREVRWGPRTIDVDILLWDREMIREDGLTVPHPRMGERAFVLWPLRDLAGNIPIPGTGKHLDDFLKRLPSGQEISKLEGNLFNTDIG
ncbi:2-amino-4-hydroxy-6-hydroxymethyldihydropteridine diphosphokinase [Staphylospora marina]|uniref:2-amino-4-hydroxy-6- hydroxymethyldihydropteridine diphosphokinase n=1 Tax=Staphylospora marina TaxID=2490858 RepID=UPI000F5C22D0|nr:2-amino-4-hydroxy-6-hydroxymethyldihydropteridine diphosphokinase [Staphylospora marina]